jgi:hypothetical protein
MLETNLTTLLSIVKSVLIFLYLLFSSILGITAVIFTTLTIILFVIGILLTILYFIVYKNKKLKLMLDEQITELEVFFLVGICSLIYIGVIYVTIKLVNFSILYTILVHLYAVI